MTKTFLSLFLLLSIAAFSQNKNIDKALIDKLLVQSGTPAISLAVLNEKGIESLLASGVKDQSSPQTIDDNTVFSAASLSKPVFSYLVLKLADEGKIDLDKPLFQYVPYRAIEHDERYKTITARMVLCHRTGLPNWRNGRLNLIRQPNQLFGYSGEAFGYLQGVVMTLTNQPIEVLAKKYVFEPLGMTSSSFVWQKDFEGNFATNHDPFGRPTPNNRFTDENVAFTLQTTAQDYARFLVELLKNSPKDMTKTYSKVGNTLRDTTSVSQQLAWGLGVGLYQNGSEKGFWHWGDNGGFKSFFYVSQNQKHGLVYFTNGSNGLSFFEEIVQNTLKTPIKSISQFLEYDTYQKPTVQLALAIPKVGVSQAVKPYKKGDFSEKDLMQLADGLGFSSLAKESKDLFKFIAEQYNSTAAAKKYAFAALKNGDWDDAKTALGQYLSKQKDDAEAKQLLTQLTQKQTGNVTIRLTQFPKARLLTLAGSFNNWQPLHTLFKRAGNEWVCQLQLPAGKYTYKIVADGNWQTDPSNSKTENDGSGNVNSVLEVKE
jgi:CubicO group peptidase (beta-lactamase class C family)